MNIRIALLLALACTAVPVSARGPTTTGAPPTPASQMVGLWAVQGSVTPCANPAAPPMIIRTTLLFHSGGTVTENPRVLPKVTGPGRSFGLGTWSYDRQSRRYAAMLRFDNYVDGVYVGYQTIDRDFAMSTANAAAGSVVASGYNANDVQVVELCGTFVQTRL